MSTYGPHGGLPRQEKKGVLGVDNFILGILVILLVMFYYILNKEVLIKVHVWSNMWM
jgi:hypothetical protein